MKLKFKKPKKHHLEIDWSKEPIELTPAKQITIKLIANPPVNPLLETTTVWYKIEEATPSN